VPTVCYIHVERPDGTLRRTADRDRKDLVLRRILDFALWRKRSGPTVYVKSVVGELTDGAFRFGMIARLVLRDFWGAGQAPTLRQFADEWLRATEAHTQPRPEGAYLVDLARGEAGAGWKRTRIRKARAALKGLAQLVNG
jgi:hypothetical protein